MWLPRRSDKPKLVKISGKNAFQFIFETLNIKINFPEKSSNLRMVLPGTVFILALKSYDQI